MDFAGRMLSVLASLPAQVMVIAAELGVRGMYVQLGLVGMYSKIVCCNFVCSWL